MHDFKKNFSLATYVAQAATGVKLSYATAEVVNRDVSLSIFIPNPNTSTY